QPFLAILVRSLFPDRTLVVVTDGLKTQESFLQDAETWLAFAFDEPSPKPANDQRFGQQPPKDRPLFYPAWEILPHESRLPHADVISERLETLVALSNRREEEAPIVVTSVAALLQRTFARKTIACSTRTLKPGDHLDPLDLVDWLEDH